MYTAICLLAASAASGTSAEVTSAIPPLTAAEVAAYARTGVRRQGRGVRGAGAGMCSSTGSQGSFSNVVGLPMTASWRCLRGRGGRVTRQPGLVRSRVERDEPPGIASGRGAAREQAAWVRTGSRTPCDGRGNRPVR